jgi:two-component system, NarL family, nitrate/nitrite response regulator NarL
MITTEPKSAVLLTRRELEVVGCLREGLSNKQIAKRFDIEVATVKNHVHNILGKLAVHRRADAATATSGWG